MSDRGITSQPLSSRSVMADQFFWRSMMLGAAGLGFLATFILWGQHIASQVSVMLPLIIFLSVYLVLVSLNTLWVAQTTAKIGAAARPGVPASGSAMRTRRIVQTLASLGFGAVAAIWYIHTVAK